MERKECVVVGAGLAGLAAAYRRTQEKRTILLRLQSRNSRTGLWKTLPTPTPYRGAQVKVVTALDIKQQPWQKGAGWQGFMEGAVVTGKAAAAAVLRY
ncbi:MAG TPA: FAD-binding protein [Terriglobales bacterium]|nr:FAD-binding protein [Terriglobales bacterium]